MSAVPVHIFWHDILPDVVFLVTNNPWATKSCIHLQAFQPRIDLWNTQPWSIIFWAEMLNRDCHCFLGNFFSFWKPDQPNQKQLQHPFSYVFEVFRHTNCGGPYTDETRSRDGTKIRLQFFMAFPIHEKVCIRALLNKYIGIPFSCILPCLKVNNPDKWHRGKIFLQFWNIIYHAPFLPFKRKLPSINTIELEMQCRAHNTYTEVVKMLNKTNGLSKCRK